MHRQTPLDALIARETRAERKRQAELQRARSGRTDDSVEILLLDQAIDALAAKLGCPYAAFARIQGRLIRIAPKVSDIKSPARKAADALFSAQGREA